MINILLLGATMQKTISDNSYVQTGPKNVNMLFIIYLRQNDNMWGWTFKSKVSYRIEEC